MRLSSKKAELKAGLISCLAVLVTGCATQAYGIYDQIQEYRISSVEVSFYEELDLGNIFGLTRLDLETDEEFADRVRGTLEDKLWEEVKDSLPGQRPVVLQVKIGTMEISSGVGRAVFGTSSDLTGSVALVESATNETVAENVFTATDKAMGGSLGVLVNITVAATTSEVDRIVDRFSDEIKEWLEN